MFKTKNISFEFKIKKKEMIKTFIAETKRKHKFKMKNIYEDDVWMCSNQQHEHTQTLK